jgi:outer membrane lipoprotein SlyB
MKKVFLALAVIVTLSLTSCKHNDATHESSDVITDSTSVDSTSVDTTKVDSIKVK